MFTIYKLKNKINNKIYIGVTNNFKKRMREHKNPKNNYLISRAIRKYGWEYFDISILTETLDEYFAYNIAEKHYINLYKSNNPTIGYNMTNGGQGTTGYIPSIETRNLMRDKKKGKVLSEEHRRKISNSNKGKKFSDESKSKISKKLMGNKNFLGKVHTNETKEILSNLKAKSWNVISPTGEFLKVYNMRKFCIENNLHSSAMSKVLAGKIPHHKQWKKA